MAEKNLHITKHNDKWKIVEENKPKSVKILKTQREAIDTARKILKDSAGGGELLIHGVDGKIRARDTISPAHKPAESGRFALDGELKFNFPDIDNPKPKKK